VSSFFGGKQRSFSIRSPDYSNILRVPGYLIHRLFWESVNNAEMWFGLRVRTLTPEMARQLGISKAEGVVIEHVEGVAVARDVGLQNGDVILEVNRQRIRNESDYRAAMEKAKPDQGVLFLVNRKGSMVFVSLKEGK